MRYSLLLLNPVLSLHRSVPLLMVFYVHREASVLSLSLFKCFGMSLFNLYRRLNRYLLFVHHSPIYIYIPHIFSLIYIYIYYSAIWKYIL